MSDPQSSSVLIISNDTAVVEAIVSNNTSEQTFNARQSVQETLNELSLLENNGIVIFDIATTDNDVDTAIDQAIKLKQADPTQVLMIVGDKDPLNEILKSNIQPMVYRAFNKPISPNQMFLSFKSAEALHQELVEKQAAGEDILVIGPQENKTSVDTLAAERKTNPLIYAGAGVAVIAILAFLFLSGGNEGPKNEVVIDIPEQVETVSVEETNINAQLSELNQLASNALLDGRYISPKGNNALEYYDRALTIDPYDAVAYDGRKAVASALRSSYNNLMKKQKFDEALTAVNALIAIEPLNPDNEKLQNDLQKAVVALADKERKDGEAKAAADRAKLLAKIESSKPSSSVSAARKTEQGLISQIKSSLSNNNLIPPKSNNAYSLLSSGLKTNKISKSNASPLIKSLSAKLLSRANSTFASGNLSETNKLMSLINRIDGGSQGLAQLRSKLNARKIALAKGQDDSAAKVAQEAREEADRKARESAARIIPAKIISRSAPRYPSSAQKRNIEGWVQLKFVVDIKGVPQNVVVEASQPNGVFEDAALKSIRKWLFSPARNQETGEAVESKPISTKLNFRLDG